MSNGGISPEKVDCYTHPIYVVNTHPVYVGRCMAVFSDVIRVTQRGKVDSSHYAGRNVPQ